LETVKANSTDVQKENALGEVMVEIRNDLIKDTKLTTNLNSQDFKIYSAR
jgi:predicted N-formylglutamate amidohydrolase